ncbi:MAG: hypothetical protein QOC64_1024 [Solirubrobacteraceae bacterium]|nr:hypothetical protein [Solirubrobacteraceae bacterium]
MDRVDDTTPLDPHEQELAEQGRALVAAAVARTRAPQGLRERIEGQRRPAAPRWRGRLALAGSLAGLVAAGAAVIAIWGGGTAAPTVAAAAELGARGPVLPAPAVDPRNPVLLRTAIEGVPFPEWDRAFEWRAVGARRDEIADRPAATVFYDRPRAGRIAYTILGGPPIDPPQNARRVSVRGTTVHLMRQGSRQIVTWERGGHTCVMTAPAAMPQDRLVDLAAWDAGGSVPF